MQLTEHAHTSNALFLSCSFMLLGN